MKDSVELALTPGAKNVTQQPQVTAWLFRLALNTKIFQIHQVKSSIVVIQPITL